MELSPSRWSQVSYEQCVLWKGTINIDVIGVFQIINMFLSSNLEKDGLGHFEVDSESGDIRTTELFTHNAEPYYTLRIRARDGGRPPLEDEAVIYVQVRSLAVGGKV